MMNIWLEMRKQQCTASFGEGGLSRINKAICTGQRSALPQILWFGQPEKKDETVHKCVQAMKL